MRSCSGCGCPIYENVANAFKAWWGWLPLDFVASGGAVAGTGWTGISKRYRTATMTDTKGIPGGSVTNVGVMTYNALNGKVTGSVDDHGFIADGGEPWSVFTAFDLASATLVREDRAEWANGIPGGETSLQLSDPYYVLDASDSGNAWESHINILLANISTSYLKGMTNATLPDVSNTHCVSYNDVLAFSDGDPVGYPYNSANLFPSGTELKRLVDDSGSQPDPAVVFGSSATQGGLEGFGGSQPAYNYCDRANAGWKKVKTLWHYVSGQHCVAESFSTSDCGTDTCYMSSSADSDNAILVVPAEFTDVLVDESSVSSYRYFHFHELTTPGGPCPCVA